jgi:hypothetical protein
VLAEGRLRIEERHVHRLAAPAARLADDVARDEVLAEKPPPTMPTPTACRALPRFEVGAGRPRRLRGA